MLELVEKDSETVIIYGTKQDVYDSMSSFMESKSLVMTTSYNNCPAIIVKKQKQMQK